ncbi:glycosyltransferase [Salinisphaera sp. T31B1]|uniref:glycosyltransferase n=1 Tax=Salinisphaera sp. T31B1 TaxID=727963 RepID=UPI003342B2F7
MRTLYITWDGPGTNYLESLFLPIFQELQRRGTSRFSIQQYAWESESRSASVAAAAVNAQMRYRVRDVGWRPQSLVAGGMMLAGGLGVAHVARRDRIDVLMPRSIIPAAMSLVAVRFLRDVKLLYDADGLKADERADFGGWRRDGKMYRLFRRIENAAVARADGIVTRTRHSRDILAERSHNPSAILAKTTVTSNGKNSALFTIGDKQARARTRKSIGVSENAPLVVYAGSLGAQYFPERMVAFFERLLRVRPDTHVLWLTGTPGVARSLIAQRPLLQDACTIKSVSPGDVPALLASADLGLAFRARCLSQQAVAPIKVGEYLLCGVPVFGSAGIGDLDSQIDNSVGFLTAVLTDEALDAAVHWFLDEVLRQRERFRARCRAVGLEHFSLERSADQYQAAFQELQASACPNSVSR